jgi:hypothetical protein
VDSSNHNEIGGGGQGARQQAAAGRIAMSPSVEQASRAGPDIVRAPVVAAWSELNAYLERRSKELSEEVRNYPTPIARCDEQLTKLIEQRARAFDRLKLLHEVGPPPSGHAGRRWFEGLDEFLLMLPQVFTDDERELAIHSRLRAALSALRDKL